MVHAVPFQCSTSGPFVFRSSPTAHASDGETAATPKRRWLDPERGTATTCHAPFTKRSVNGTERLLRFSVPTAHACGLPGTTATSVRRPSRPAGCGVATR